VDEALQSQARRLADGNPRLLEWLNKVLLNLDPPQPPLKRGEQNTVAEILARLEVDPVELREQVLAEALLAQIDKPLEEMLQRGLVFELPVPREAIAAVCESIPNLEQQINRAVALGLLEVSPDSSLRVPRIMPLKLPEDAESLHKQAAEVLYRFWLEEAERTTEEKLLEIHQLALHGKTEKIAVTIAKIVTNRWFSRGQFREAIKICKDTLEVVKEYDILNRLAYAEQHVCEVDKALKHYQQALNLCPSEDEKGKAAILHNLASLRERDGRIKEAEALYQQAVEIDERLGNLKGKIQAWIALGLLKSSLGNFEETIPPLQELLELTKGISDIEEKAAVLFQLARLAANTRKIEEAMHIFQEALKINEKTDNIYSIAMILQWMGGLTADVKQNFNTGLNYLQRSLNILQNIQSLEAQREADKVIQIIARVQWMRDNGNVQEKTETLFQQGMLKAKSGEIEEAITLFQQLQEIHKLIGNVKDEALALAMLGQLLLNKGEFKIARYYLQQSLDIFQRFQIPGAETEKQAIARVQQMRDDIS
jgi:tetratricopeptide (TPR) repeat protein